MKSSFLKLSTWFKQKHITSKIGLIFLTIFLVVLFFVSTIAKWYINTNGEKLSGRKIHLENLSINYFSFSISLDDFVMYEPNKKDTFIHLGSAYVNINPWALFNNKYDVSAIELNSLEANIIKVDSTFNFSDLISSKPTDTVAEPIQFYLNNIKITNSTLDYIDQTSQTTYPLHNINLSVPQIHWNADKMNTDLAFKLGKRGRINIDLIINNKTESYEIDLKTRYIDLIYGEPELKKILNIESNTGFLHTDLNIRGDFNTPEALVLKGKTAISQLQIIDKKEQSFSSIDSIAITIDSINLNKNYYAISETTIYHPVIHLTMLPKSTNIDYVLAPLFEHPIPQDSTTVTHTTVVDTTKNQNDPFHFLIDRAKIHNGTIKYIDSTLNRPFNYSITSIEVASNHIGANSRNLTSQFSLQPNGKGSITGNAIFDVVNSENITLNSIIKDIDLHLFSPYSEYYIGAPITQGTFNYDLGFTMTSTHMSNTNKFDFKNLEFGKKTKIEPVNKVPIKLALAILKDKDNNIQFDVPVSGNPSNPDFKVLPIVWKTLRKFMIKVAASPLSTISTLAGSDSKNNDKLQFDYGQDSLNEKQKSFLDKIVAYQTKKPQLTFKFVQTTNITEEMNQITLNKAPITPAQLSELIEKRNNTIQLYLQTKKMPPNSYTISTGHTENTDTTKKPFFKITVSIN